MLLSRVRIYLAAGLSVVALVLAACANDKECDPLNQGVPQIRRDEVLLDNAGPSSNVAPGDVLTVSGQGTYEDAVSVELFWDEVIRPPLATGGIESGCRFSVDIVVPAGASGPHQVVVQLLDDAGRLSLESSHTLVVGGG
jgi:hypothetical protein